MYDKTLELFHCLATEKYDDVIKGLRGAKSLVNYKFILFIISDSYFIDGFAGLQIAIDMAFIKLWNSDFDYNKVRCVCALLIAYLAHFIMYFNN